MKTKDTQPIASATGLGDQFLISVVAHKQEEDLGTIVNNPGPLRISRKDTEVRGFRLLLADYQRQYTDEQKYASAFITILEIAGFISKESRKNNFKVALTLFSGGIPLDEKIKWNHQHKDSNKYPNLTWLQLFYFFDTMVARGMIEVKKDQFLKRIEVDDILLAFFECSSEHEFKPKDIQNAINKYSKKKSDGILQPPVGQDLIVQNLIQSTAILTQLDHAIFKNVVTP